MVNHFLSLLFFNGFEFLLLLTKIGKFTSEYGFLPELNALLVSNEESKGGDDSLLDDNFLVYFLWGKYLLSLILFLS